MKQNGPVRCLSVKDMNPKLKRAKLNAAFKKVQRLPALAPRTEEQRASAANANQQTTGMRVVLGIVPPPNGLGQQFLAE